MTRKSFLHSNQPFLALVLLVITACQPAATPPIPTPVEAVPTFTAIPTSIPTTLPSLVPTQTPTVLPSPVLSAPLEGYTFLTIQESITNPYNPQPPGSDDPHQGIDIAQLYGENRIALSGLPIQAVLSGKVVETISDRFPYGNGVMIETPLSALPPDWIDSLQLPAAYLGPIPNTALSCPDLNSIQYPQDDGPRSLYILYAHLEQPVGFANGDSISSGTILSSVGSTGNALNPHLHLEMRIGPSGSTFGSMAHYDPSATIEEMDTYCLWRVSGQYLPIDPLLLLQHLSG